MSPLSESLFKRYDRQVWILLGGSLINSFGYSIAYPFISLYLYVYRGVPMTDVGLALLVSAIAGSVGQIAGGEICDRIGRKISMVAGLGLNALSFALLAIAILSNSDYVLFVVLMCLRQFAGGLYVNVPSVMVADVVESGDRNGAFSLLRIGGNLGFALGPILGGIIATYSYAVMFGVTAVTSTLYLLITVFLLRDTRPCRSGTGNGASHRQIWSDYPFLWFCGVSAIVFLVYAQLFTTFGTYSGSFGHLNETSIGLLFSLNGFLVVLFQYPVAVFLERFRLTTSLAAGSLIYAAGFALIGFSTGWWPLFACMFLISIGELLSSPPSMNLTSRLAPPEGRGRYMSFSGMTNNVGMAFGPALGGFLMDAYSGDIKIMWLIFGGLGLLCVLGFLGLRAVLKPETDGL